ncbi:MAG: MBL fold metallo-hydrolase [Planctomycetota bacterium]
MSFARAALLALSSFVFVACDGARAKEPETPYVVVLGTAQDGGLPQIGCERACCERVRAHPELARRVTSLLLVDPRDGKRWLIDASPDLPEQVASVAGVPPNRRPAAATGGRPPLFDGIFLTHAHVGHYLGLASLGREAYGVVGQTVYATERMEDFLCTNGPWSLLVESGGVEVRRVDPGRAVRLADDLVVEALLVPHRDEFSDTLAFVVRGPDRSLLYLPDIDKWERWGTRIEDVLSDVDVALVDGTFFDADELPGRAMSEIPHPFVVESLERFAGLPGSERAKIRFTHLNHTNPAADPASEEAREVERAGLAIAADGERHRL